MGEWANTEPMWNRDSLYGDVETPLEGSLPLIAQHPNSRLEISSAQGYPGIFNRALNQTPVSCKILIVELCTNRFVFLGSTLIVNNKPPFITPESLLCASVKLFIIIQLSDYACPFVYLSYSERQKVLKHLQTRQLIYFHIICPPILHVIICNQSPKLQDAFTFYISEWPITSAVRRISIEHWYSCLDMNTLCLCRYGSPQKETLFPECWRKQKTIRNACKEPERDW